MDWQIVLDFEENYRVDDATQAASKRYYDRKLGMDKPMIKVFARLAAKKN